MYTVSENVFAALGNQKECEVVWWFFVGARSWTRSIPVYLLPDVDHSIHLRGKHEIPEVSTKGLFHKLVV